MKPLANPAAASSFFASARSCLKYLALGPKSLPLGSSHQPLQNAGSVRVPARLDRQALPLRTSSTLKNASMYRSRSQAIENGLPHALVEERRLAAGSLPKAMTLVPVFGTSRVGRG